MHQKNNNIKEHKDNNDDKDDNHNNVKYEINKNENDIVVHTFTVPNDT